MTDNVEPLFDATRLRSGDTTCFTMAWYDLSLQVLANRTTLPGWISVTCDAWTQEGFGCRPTRKGERPSDPVWTRRFRLPLRAGRLHPAIHPDALQARVAGLVWARIGLAGDGDDGFVLRVQRHEQNADVISIASCRGIARARGGRGR